MQGPQPDACNLLVVQSLLTGIDVLILKGVATLFLSQHLAILGVGRSSTHL